MYCGAALAAGFRIAGELFHLGVFKNTSPGLAAGRAGSALPPPPPPPPFGPSADWSETCPAEQKFRAPRGNFFGQASHYFSAFHWQLAGQLHVGNEFAGGQTWLAGWFGVVTRCECHLRLLRAVMSGYTYAVCIRNVFCLTENDKCPALEGRFAFIQWSVTPRCWASPSA